MADLKKIEELISELITAKEAMNILEEVWLDVGEFGEKHLSSEIFNKLEYFVRFKIKGE